MGFLVIFCAPLLLLLALMTTGGARKWSDETGITVVCSIMILSVVIIMTFAVGLPIAHNQDERQLIRHNELREELKMMHEVDEGIRMFIIKDIVAYNSIVKEAKKDNKSWFFGWFTSDELAEAELIEIPEEYRKMLVRLRLLGMGGNP